MILVKLCLYRCCTGFSIQTICCTAFPKDFRERFLKQFDRFLQTSNSQRSSPSANSFLSGQSAPQRSPKPFVIDAKDRTAATHYHASRFPLELKRSLSDPLRHLETNCQSVGLALEGVLESPCLGHSAEMAGTLAARPCVFTQSSRYTMMQSPHTRCSSTANMQLLPSCTPRSSQ